VTLQAGAAGRGRRARLRRWRAVPDAVHVSTGNGPKRSVVAAARRARLLSAEERRGAEHVAYVAHDDEVFVDPFFSRKAHAS
jgi:hypothetical protein